MDIKNIMKLREFFTELCDFCDTLEQKGLWKKDSDLTLKLRDILKYDVARYMMYLSASDGYLSSEEVQMYRIITGYGGDTVQTIREHIKSDNIYSTEFESEVPWIIQLVTQCEREAIFFGYRSQSKETAAELFADFFEILGETLISVDGGISYSEKRDLRIYTSTIRSYIQENSNAMNNWVDGD